MDAPIPLTIGELLVIACKEIAKPIPFLGQILSAGESVFNKIETNRMKLVLQEMMSRIEDQEKRSGRAQVFDEKAAQVLLYGCDQARHDLLVEKKAKEYGGVLAYCMTEQTGLDEVMEILDNLRKLNSTDLKLLYGFRSDEGVISSRRVDELVGYQAQIDPFSSRGKLREKMVAAFPSLRRLEGLGILYLAQSTGAGIVHEIGELSSYMKQTAFLTDSGRRLIRALPA